MRNLKVLLTADDAQLAEVYADVCGDLAELYDRAGWLRSQVEHESVAGFRDSREGSVAGRDRDVRARIVDWKAELLQIEGAVDARRVEARFLERLLDARG